MAPGSEPIPDDALDMIRDLKQALLHKQDKHEARTMHDDLLNRIAELQKSEGGIVISESDFKKWNLNCTKTAHLEDLLEKLKRDFT